MTRGRLLTAAGALGLALALPGCITLFSQTDVIRGDETRRAVRYESPKAASAFHRGMAKQEARVGGTYFGVPFVTVYNRDKVLSENARFNEAVARCDTDQDGHITEAESVIYEGVTQ